MPSSPSPSSSVQAARQALADRLRALREAAGLTSTQLSAAAGWGRSKTSRIEHAVQPATAQDIRTWTEVCRAPEHADDLVAALRVAEGAYVEWRRLHQTGMRHTQQTYLPLYEKTRLFRCYQSHVVPGLLQTSAYMTALMRAITDHQGTPDDVDQAVQARLARRRVMHMPGHRYVFVLEESVLSYALGGPQAMAEQLDFLHEVAEGALVSASLGVIPAARADRSMWPLEAFTLYDAAQAHVELLTARVTVSAPSELDGYRRAFEVLASMSVWGQEAATLITSALRGVR